MVISLYLQVKLVIFSLLAGVITGFLFDLYRTFRGLENVHKIFIIIEDLLFWILTSIIVFIFLLFTNYAFMGMYVYIYIIIGAYIYMVLLSKTLVSAQLKLINFFSKLFRVVFKHISYPMKLLGYNLISKNKRNFKKNDLNKI